MKKITKKRVLSFLLVAAFLIQFLPIVVFATPEEGIRVFATTFQDIVPWSGTVDIQVNVTIDPSAMPAADGTGWAAVEYWMMFDPSIFTLVSPPSVLDMAMAGVNLLVQPNPIAPPPNLIAGEQYVYVLAVPLVPGNSLGIITKTYTFQVNTDALPNPLPEALYIRLYLNQAVSNLSILSAMPTRPTDYARIPIVADPLVIFDLQGGTGTFPLVQTVTFGSIATRPTPDPTREGYEFAGWWTDWIGGMQFDFETPIMWDIMLYARWTALPTSIARFHDDNGILLAELPIVDGRIEGQIPTPATRYGRLGTPGQVFMGWFTDQNPTHYVRAADRAEAFDITQAIAPAMLTGGVLSLYGSWLSFGDVNGNGEVNISDLILLQRFLLRDITANEIVLRTADVNVDGMVNMADLIWLQRHLLREPGVILGVPAP